MEPAYEALNGEIEKMADPSATGITDWQRVAELASGLLTDKGKDIQVACYLGAALVHQQRVEGLGIALKILGDLVENYWDTMFPPAARIRGRRAALEWWLERILSEFSGVTVPPLSPEELAVLKTNFERLDTQYRAKDPDGPMLNRIGSLINGFSVKEAAAPAGEGSTAPAAAQDGALSGPIADSGAALEVALIRIGQIAGKLREEKVANPLAYRLARIAIWTQLEQIPPVGPEGRTAVPPPPGQDLEMLKSLRTGEAEPIVAFAESRLSEYPFWIDLNRASSEALKRMGESMNEAESAVRRETVNWLNRLPGLESAVFSDGTPFADTGTTSWLAEARAAFGGGSSSSGGSTAGLDEALVAALKEAQEQADGGKFLDAVATLDAYSRATASERVRLVLRIRLCEMIISNDSNRDLRPYLAPLLETVDRHHLESWEPALAAQALSLIYRAMGTDFEPGAGLPSKTEILRRIVVIDYGNALKLPVA
jgi:type VI secretion system protein VasJ